jgi:hypothetical protein
MGTTLSSTGGGKTFAPAPSGNHRALCIAVYDIGTQLVNYQTGPKWKKKIILSWELVDETMEDGRPFTLSSTFTASLHENSSLRPFLDNWRGRAFSEEELKGWDIKNVLGAPCLLSVIHKDGTDKFGKAKKFANVSSAGRLPKGMTVPESPHNSPRYYTVDSRTIPADIPRWIAEKVRQSVEYKENAFKDEAAEAEAKAADQNGGQASGSGSASAGQASTAIDPDADDCPF